MSQHNQDVPLVAACEADGDMFEQVESLGLGDRPAVVFNPKVVIPTVRIYERGLSQDGDVEVMQIVEHNVDAVVIRDIIDSMYQNQLATPEAQIRGASTWEKAARWWAVSNAEAIVQLQIKTALSTRLFNCDIRHEQTMRAGRSDLEIVQRRADGSTIVPAELEIKILRERNRRGRKWSDRWNEKWMRRGVRQAAAYRDGRNAKCGILWCFDMRARDRGEMPTFESVREYADELGILLDRRFLYNSSEAWREASYGA